MQSVALILCHKLGDKKVYERHLYVAEKLAFMGWIGIVKCYSVHLKNYLILCCCIHNRIYQAGLLLF